MNSANRGFCCACCRASDRALRTIERPAEPKDTLLSACLVCVLRRYDVSDINSQRLSHQHITFDVSDRTHQDHTTVYRCLGALLNLEDIVIVLASCIVMRRTWIPLKDRSLKGEVYSRTYSASKLIFQADLRQLSASQEQGRSLWPVNNRVTGIKQGGSIRLTLISSSLLLQSGWLV